LCIGKVDNQYKLAKHFGLSIADKTFTFTRKVREIAAEAALDGIHIIRTSVNAAQMDAPDCVRNYKSLVNVERAFRSLKTMDLEVLPIHHGTADRLRAHIFLCMLAYYVEWLMREAWRELMFADTDQQAKTTRDPIAPARRSKAALAKVARRTLHDANRVHSLAALLEEFGTIVRNTCRAPQARPDATTFNVLTRPNAAHRRAVELIQQVEAQTEIATPIPTPSACQRRTNALRARGNFGLGP
jgi:hypothetical protein